MFRWDFGFENTMYFLKQYFTTIFEEALIFIKMDQMCALIINCAYGNTW